MTKTVERKMQTNVIQILSRISSFNCLTSLRVGSKTHSVENVRLKEFNTNFYFEFQGNFKDYFFMLFDSIFLDFFQMGNANIDRSYSNSFEADNSKSNEL